MATTRWTRAETLAALNVYFQLSFGQLHKGHPAIRQLAPWLSRTPDAVAMKLTNFASLDPQVRASGRAGMGHFSKLDEDIWQELNTHWDAVATEAATLFDHYAQQHGVLPGSDVVDELSELDRLPAFAEGKTTTATVQVRVNQARFRKAVLASYGSRCCISGLAEPRLLVASHIVPWSMDTHNRLNPQNGLCLSALHDKAYDIGLMTVLPDFTVRVSAQLRHTKVNAFTREALTAFDGRPIAMPERFKPHPEFLESHARRFQFL
jgi:predicted restriction endonuclease